MPARFPRTGTTPEPASAASASDVVGERLGYLAAALDGYVYDWNLVAGVVSRSQGLLKLLDVTPEEVEDAPDWWLGRIHPDDLEGVVAEARGRFADPSLHRISTEYRVRRRDGRYCWVADRAWLVRSEGGELVRMVGITTDVTADREQREALAQATATAEAADTELRTLLDRMLDAYIAVDPEWRVLHVNRATATFQGTGAEALVGRDAWEVWPEVRGTRFEEVLRAAAGDGRPRSVVEAYEHPDRGRLWLECRVFPSPAGLSLFVRDLTEERLAAEALAATERRFTRLAEANVVGMAFWDIGGPILDANDCFLEMIGYSREEMLAGAIDWKALTPPEFAALDASKMQELLERGTHTPYEKEYLLRDGSRVPVLLAAAFFEGSRERGISVVIDQTASRAAEAERRRLLEAEQAARQRTEHLQRLSADLTRPLTPAQVAEVVVHHMTLAFDAYAGGVVELSADGLEFVMLGTLGMDDQIRRRYARFPRDAAVPVRDVVQTHEPVFLESRSEWEARYPPLAADTLLEGTDDGAWAALPLLVEERLFGALTVSIPGPRPIPEDERRFMRTFADLCAQALERARLYEAAAKAQARAEFLSEASRLLAASLDYTETLEAVARAAVPALGDWCAVDMVAAPERDEWPPEVRRLAVMHQDPTRLEWARDVERRAPHDWNAPGGFPRVLREGVTEFYPVVTDEMMVASARTPEELALLREIGFTAYLCVPLVLRGRTAGAITLCMTDSGRHYVPADRDLGEELARRAALAIEQAELYREAQEANQSKSAFLAMMSHELRTPLNAIGGYAELIELGIHGPVTDEQRAALDRIRHSQRHLLGLINNVLNFARIEAGQVVYDLRPMLIADVLNAAVALVVPQARGKTLALEVIPCDTSVTAHADAEKVQQILLNLLSNAVKFTPEGGRISLACAQQDGQVDIVVADTGIGIPEDRLAAVFEAFVQVHSGTTRLNGGTGLGLAISRDLARAMGGELRVQSTLGAGSVFTLSLPAAEPHPLGIPHAAPEADVA
jgi:PAS domain S-box-containing protein